MLATYPVPMTLPRILVTRESDRPLTAVERVARALHVGPMTFAEIVSALGINRQIVASILARRRDLFEFEAASGR
jgi:CRP-like cAMP-binding protein